MPAGRAAWVQLRGTENMAVLPVAGSMLTVIIVSVRIPVRPSPKSPPSKRMFRRSSPSQGATVGGATVGATVVVTPPEAVTAPDVAAWVVVVVSAATSSSPKTDVRRLYWTRS